MRRWIAVGVLILVVGVAWRVMSATRRAETPGASEAGVPVEVRPVETTTLVERVSAGGSITAVREVLVTTKLTARVAAVLVKEGDDVRTGQVLVRLESDDIQAQVRQASAGLAAAEARLRMLEEGARPQERAQVDDQVRSAEANLAAAEARLRMLEDGARPQERAQADAAVAQARANYETARANLERMRMLYDTGAISKAQLDAAELQHDLARAQYDAAVQQRNLVQTGPRSQEIEMARSQVEAARAQLDAARQQRALVQQGARDQEIQMARAQVAQARAAVAYARLQLANATVVAPFAGTITRRLVEPGQLVTPMPGQGSLMMVAQIDTVYAGLDVSETDLGRIRVGQPVTLRIDAYPDRTFTGTVSELGYAADPRVRVFRIKVAVPNPDHALKPGMFARGDITVATHADTMVIPRSAVVTAGGRTVVFVAQAGTARARTVRLGIASGPMVQVLSGVSKGDAVIVAGQDGLTDGTPVSVR